METTPRDAALSALTAWHARVDEEASALAAAHGPRITCRRGCSGCCVDDLTVFEVEAERIRRSEPDLLAAGLPGPPGACAFLDPDGACRIYAYRPYVCRTQGLPLRWLDVDDDDEPVEYRDICHLNDPGEPTLETMSPETLWTLGDHEEILRRLQTAFAGSNTQRVPLRSLFARASEDRR